MKKILMVILCIGLLVAPVQAGVWFGGHLGPNWTNNSDVNFKAPPLKGTLNNVTTNTGVLAGLIVGYDFDKKHGFPAWSEYFGVALDFSYNPFNQPAQQLGGTILPASVNSVNVPQIEGYQLALAFLVKGQYPFLKSTEFPKGRLFPYLMVGPAVVWTTSLTNAISSQLSTNVGLVTEVGVQYFIVQNLAASAGFRYRHVWGPTFDFKRNINYIHADTTTDQFSALLRLTYHF